MSRARVAVEELPAADIPLPMKGSVLKMIGGLQDAIETVLDTGCVGPLVVLDVVCKAFVLKGYRELAGAVQRLNLAVLIAPSEQ